MARDDDQQDDDFDKAHSSLNDGLETCRSVVANYRTLLGREVNDAGDERQAPREGDAN